jgi:hypothetical protein
MTNGTVGELIDFDTIFSYKLPTQFNLIARRLPAHGKNFFQGSNIAFGGAMTVQTPVHVQRFGFGDNWHLINPAMTGFAADALSYMNAMVKIDKISQIMNSNPGQRLIVFKTGSNRFQHGRFSGYLGMATHAGFSQRDAGKIRPLDRRMTIATIKPKPAHMEFKTIRERLGFRQTNLGQKGGLDKKVTEAGQAKQAEYDPKKTNSDNDVDTWGE